MMGIKDCQRMKSPASYFSGWGTWALGSCPQQPYLPPNPTQPTPYSLGTRPGNHGPGDAVTLKVREGCNNFP